MNRRCRQKVLVVTKKRKLTVIFFSFHFDTLYKEKRKDKKEEEKDSIKLKGHNFKNIIRMSLLSKIPLELQNYF